MIRRHESLRSRLLATGKVLIDANPIDWSRDAPMPAGAAAFERLAWEFYAIIRKLETMSTELSHQRHRLALAQREGNDRLAARIEGEITELRKATAGVQRKLAELEKQAQALEAQPPGESSPKVA